MRRLALTGLLFSLACALGEPADDDEEDEEDDEVDGDPTCDAYVDCAAVVDPALAADLAEAYAEGGSCWSSGAGADTCIAACTAGLTDYQTANPDTDACFETTGPLGAQPLRAGTWTFALTLEGGECEDFNALYLREWEDALVGDVDPAAGTFTLAYYGEMACTGGDHDFACGVWFEGTSYDNLTITMEGIAEADGESASGSWALSADRDPCEASGSFTAGRD